MKQIFLSQNVLRLSKIDTINQPVVRSIKPLLILLKELKQEMY